MIGRRSRSSGSGSSGGDACALVEIDNGRDVGPIDAFRLALRGCAAARRARDLRRAVGGAHDDDLPRAGRDLAAVRWSLLAPVVELEERRPFPSLRRSGALVRGRWIKVGSLVGVSAALALLAGPLLGAILILLTDTPLALLNVVAGVVYALAMPFVALVTSYVYFDARARLELEPVERVSELPAEIGLATTPCGSIQNERPCRRAALGGALRRPRSRPYRLDMGAPCVLASHHPAHPVDG